MSADVIPRKVLSHRALIVIAWLHLAGVVAIAIHAMTTTSLASAMSSLSVGVLVSGACAVTGALGGFLFGIPRSLQGQPTTDEGGLESKPNAQSVSYRANTNLEQISDWLTKILIGVGLTQLSSIPMKLRAVSGFVAPSLGSSQSSIVIAAAIIVYFLVFGFLFGYLWTRLFLAGALRNADLAAIDQKLTEIEQRAKRDAEALLTVHSFLNSNGEPGAPSESDLRDAIAGASPGTRMSTFMTARDQRTTNWRLPETKARMERTIPVFRAFVSLGEAQHEYFGQLGYALKDKAKPDWAEAERVLTEAIRLRGSWKEHGWLFYEFNRALCRIAREQALDESSDEAKELVAQVREDLRAVAAVSEMRDLIMNDSRISPWMKKHRLTLANL